MDRNSQADSDRAIEAQAKQDKLAQELQISNKELECLKTLSELITNRLDAAPTELFVSSGETHLKKKMPNNTRALEAFGEEHIESNAQQWVESNSIGRAIAGLNYPAPLDKAKTSLAGAANRLFSSPGDEDREVSYAKAVRWLAQMQCQAQYKEALAPIFDALYRLQTGGQYVAQDKTLNAETSDETLKLLMA